MKTLVLEDEGFCRESPQVLEELFGAGTTDFSVSPDGTFLALSSVGSSYVTIFDTGRWDQKREPKVSDEFKCEPHDDV